jgi:hypothetical protein
MGKGDFQTLSLLLVCVLCDGNSCKEPPRFWDQIAIREIANISANDELEEAVLHNTTHNNVIEPEQFSSRHTTGDSLCALNYLSRLSSWQQMNHASQQPGNPMSKNVF